MYTNGIIAHKTEKDDFMFSVLFFATSGGPQIQSPRTEVFLFFFQ